MDKPLQSLQCRFEQQVRGNHDEEFVDLLIESLVEVIVLDCSLNSLARLFEQKVVKLPETWIQDLKIPNALSACKRIVIITMTLFGFLIAMYQDQKLCRARVPQRCECRKGWTKLFWSPTIGPSAVFADFAAGGLAMWTFCRVFGGPRVKVMFG